THLSIPCMSSEASDSLESYLSVFGVENYDISAISLNYKGLTIEGVPGLKLQPDLDALISFEQEINLDSVIAIVLAQNDMFVRTKNGFSYGKVEYYVHQYNEHTIYIGRKPFSQDLLVRQNPKVIFELSGMPNHITEL